MQERTLREISKRNADGAFYLAISVLFTSGVIAGMVAAVLIIQHGGASVMMPG